MEDHEPDNHHERGEFHNGRTVLSARALAAVQIQTEQAAPRTIKSTISANGKLALNEDKVAHIIPRFAGIAKHVKKNLGDKIAPGDVLAVIESNQSLQPYEVRSQITGTVVKRHITNGEFVPENQDIFVVADLASLWADFRIYRSNLTAIKAGQTILVLVGDNTPPLRTTISYISPFGEEATQSIVVRAVVPTVIQVLTFELFRIGSSSRSLKMFPE